MELSMPAAFGIILILLLLVLLVCANIRSLIRRLLPDAADGGMKAEQVGLGGMWKWSDSDPPLETQKTGRPVPPKSLLISGLNAKIYDPYKNEYEFVSGSTVHCFLRDEKFPHKPSSKLKGSGKPLKDTNGEYDSIPLPLLTTKHSVAILIECTIKQKNGDDYNYYTRRLAYEWQVPAWIPEGGTDPVEFELIELK